MEEYMFHLFVHIWTLNGIESKPPNRISTGNLSYIIISERVMRSYTFNERDHSV